MASPVSRLATRAAFGANQLPRIGWYLGHGVLMRRLAATVRKRDGKSSRPRAHTDKPMPGRNRLWSDLAALLRRDLANVEAGIYPLPADHVQ